MELKMQAFRLPDAPRFNFEELKDALIERTAMYETVVYSEDQIKTAKGDRANLNRLKKAINDERIRLEREYMEPFATFKAQVKELTDIIDASVLAVDKQVKAFEEKQRAEKLEQVKAYYAAAVLFDEPASKLVPFEIIIEPRWMNASTPMQAVEKAIDEKVAKIAADLAVTRSLPAYAFEAEQTYLNTLDLARAVSEAHRLADMAEQKAAYEAEQARLKAEYAAKMDAALMKPTPATVQESQTVEPAPAAEPAREWIAFQAYLTPDEARALGQYMKNNGIQYKAV